MVYFLFAQNIDREYTLETAPFLKGFYYTYICILANITHVYVSFGDVHMILILIWVAEFPPFGKDLLA